MLTGLFTKDGKQLTQAEVLKHISDRSPELRPYADRARKSHKVDAECAVDDEPIFSESNDGVWVSAWLWVENE